MAGVMFFGILLALFGASITFYVKLRMKNYLWGINLIAVVTLFVTFMTATNGDADDVIAGLQDAFGPIFGVLALWSVFGGFMYWWYGLHAYEEYRAYRLDPQDDKHPDANSDDDA